jgi:hypothetical protein
MSMTAAPVNGWEPFVHTWVKSTGIGVNGIGGGRMADSDTHPPSHNRQTMRLTFLQVVWFVDIELAPISFAYGCVATDDLESAGGFIDR